MMNLNEEIKLEGKLFDVSEMQRQQRILYLPKKGSIILKCSAISANYENATTYNNQAIVLTARHATRRFPEVFFNKNEKKVELPKRSIMLMVSNEQYDFCARKGCISDFLRSLIDREIANSNV